MPQQRVQPDQGDIEGNEPQAHPQRTKRTVRLHATPRSKSDDPKLAIQRMVREGIARAERVVLAVSGGRDSMALLHAATVAARHHVAAVATFDHRTGPWSARARELVVRHTRSLGLPVVAGYAMRSLEGATEEEMRIVRWNFLRRVARGFGARIATAHTRSDQIETIAMRIMRGAGARGIAGLDWNSPLVVRPLLDAPRDAVNVYVSKHAIPFVDDPGNLSLHRFRNRVRLELLPALERVRPGFAEELLAVGRRAAMWRREVDALIESIPWQLSADGLRVAASALSDYDSASLGVLWPAIAARAGVTLDRRGTRRAVAFTMESSSGQVMPLSGGASIVRSRDAFVVRPRRVEQSDEIVALSDGTSFGQWRFRRVPRASASDPWTADLAAGRPYVVRAWRPGDRMRAGEGAGGRRVKRFFGDAGIPGPDRIGWPVVVSGEEVVWIPGIRRARVAEGSERLSYVCDRSGG